MKIKLLENGGYQTYPITEDMIEMSEEEFNQRFNQPANEETQVISYNELVVEKIRRKYSLNDEIAILRQKQAKPDEYAMYYNYCEQCKLEARNESK